MAGDRTRRINGEIQRALAEIIKTMKDPRISIMTSVVGVETTNDLSYAKVFISVYDTDEMQASTMEALSHAHGFLRTEVGKVLKLRKIPELRIIEDHSMEQSAKISKILNDIGTSDE